MGDWEVFFDFFCPILVKSGFQGLYEGKKIDEQAAAGSDFLACEGFREAKKCPAGCFLGFFRRLWSRMAAAGAALQGVLQASPIYYRCKKHKKEAFGLPICGLECGIDYPVLLWIRLLLPANRAGCRQRSTGLRTRPGGVKGF